MDRATYYRRATGTRELREIRTAFTKDPNPRNEPLTPEEVDTCGSGLAWLEPVNIGWLPKDLTMWSDRE